MSIYIINPENIPKTNKSIIAEPIDTLEIFEVVQSKFNAIFLDLDVYTFNNFKSDDILIFVYDYILPLHTSFTLNGISNIISTYNIKNSIIISKQCLSNYKKLFDLGLKYLIYNNAELVINDLLDAIISKHDVSNINNLIFMKNKKVIKTKINKNKPDYKIINRTFDLSNYNDIRTIITSWGCNNNCEFCSTPYFQGRWHSRSVDSIIEEIESLYNNGAKKIIFLDDNFTTDKFRVIDICKKIKEKNINCVFGCLSSINNYEKDMFELMYNSGFRWIHFGIETADEKLLEQMNKIQSCKDIINCLSEVKEIGYKLRISLIIDYPNSTINTIDKTLSLIDKVRPNEIRLHHTAYRSFSPLYMKSGIRNNEYIHSQKNNIFSKVYKWGLLDLGYSVIEDINYDWNNNNDECVASFIPIKYGRNWI